MNSERYSRRYKPETVLNLKFMQLPKVFFTNPEYKAISNDAKVMYALLSDRLSLSLSNRWINEMREVYFVFPVLKLCDLTGLSKPTVIKVKKELILVRLLEEERTGRANKMYLLQPEISEADLYQISKLESNLDLGAEKLEKDEKGQATRSENILLLDNQSRNEKSLLLDNEVNDTRNQKNELLEETLIEQQSDQKSNDLTSEVKKFYPNNTELNETDEEDIKYKTRVRELISFTRLFGSADAEFIVESLSDLHVDKSIIKEQLTTMSEQTMILNPVKYFLNGINKRLRFESFKKEEQLKKAELPEISLHNWLAEN